MRGRWSVHTRNENSKIRLVPPCHRASDALRRYKSGTGLTSGITSAAPGIILVIAALSLIHCQTFGSTSNDDEREDCTCSSAA